MWGDLLNSVKTGQPAWQRLWGMDAWEYRKRNSEASALFNTYMVEVAGLLASAVATHFDFAGLHVLVDVGGGHGQFLATILKTHPSLRGILFDLPHVVAGRKPFWNPSALPIAAR